MSLSRPGARPTGGERSERPPVAHPSRMFRRWAVPAAVAATVLAVPATASAHGLVQRADLPIPDWLFAWAAAIVLVASFAALAALWPTPRLQEPRWRPLRTAGRVLAWRPL